MATHYKDNLPFCIALIFHSEQGIRRELLTFWDYESEVDRNSLIDIREMVPLYIDFYLKNPMNDIEATMQIETTRFNEEGDQQSLIISASTAGQLTRVYSRDSTQVDSREYPWRMGYYIIKVTVSGKIYYTGIQVVPNNLSLGQVNRIHQLLEDETTGICSELILSQRTFSNDQIDQTPAKWYHDYARWLHSNKQTIMACIEYIRNHWYEEIRTVHVVSTRAGIQDSKAQRWSNGAGGRLNQHALQPLYHLNRRKQLCSDNPQNQWIKLIVQRWKNELAIILNQIRSDVDIAEREIQNQFAIIEIKTRQLEEIRRLKDVPEGFHRGEKTVFHTSRNHIEKLRKWSGTLMKWSHEIESLIGTFGYLISSSSFEDVRITERKPFLKNRYYQLLDELYGRGIQIKRKEGDARQYKAIPWPTWRIYEYYALLQVMKVLYEVGFSPLVGFPDHIGNFQNQGIPEGSRFILESNVGELHVHYGKLLPYSPDDTDDSDGFYSTNEHRWPDIRIDYYKKTDNGRVYSKHSIVFDAKLSRFQYLYRATIPINAFTQLNSYVSIQHTDSLRSVVDRVCCLYAGFGDSTVKRKKHSLTYIRLCPDEKDNFIGNDELQEFIIEWLTNDVGYEL